MDWRSTGETIFVLLADKRLNIENRDLVVLELLCESMLSDRFDLAIKIWKNFEPVVTKNVKMVIDAL